MKFKCNKVKIQYNEDKQAEIVLSTKENIHIEDLKEIIAKGKELSCELKQFRNHRSLDSNAYCWVLLGKMANILQTSKEEVYLQELDRYGTYTHVIVKPEAVERVQSEWRTSIVLGDVTINGKVGVQIQCYYGSSSYNQLEMCKLLNGIVEDAKELGIDTASSRELEEMNKSWGGK